MTIPVYHALGGVLKRKGRADLTPPAATPSTVGSLAVGQASYAVPAGAIFADAVNGVETNPGTQAAPVKTFEKALTLAPTNGTIVLRAGKYHEGRTRDTGGSLGYAAIMVTTVGLTIQNYPGEAVWFDGSSVVTGFVADGSWWSRTWTPFRRDPTYSGWYGGTYPPPNNDWLVLEPDQRPGWQFVDYTNNPTAAWPERVWINGVKQTQVDLLSKMGPGKFFIDAYTNKLYVGENPAGKTVEITDLQTLMNLFAAGITLRGIGVRRYAASMPQSAVVKFQYPDPVIENVVAEDCAPIALQVIASGTSGVGAHNAVFRNITVRRCSNLGMGHTLCDNVRWERLLIEFCNDGRFNYGPSAGGLKTDRGRGLFVDQSVFRDNYGKGLWFDQDPWDIKVLRCDFARNYEKDLVLEIGGRGLIADCVFIDSGTHAIRVLNLEDVEIWNCTFLGQGARRGAESKDSFANPRQVNYQADARLPRNSGSVGIDPRIANGKVGAWPGSSTLGWVPRKGKVRNCVFGHANVQSFFGHEDFRNSDGTAETYVVAGVDLDGNVYNRNPNTTMAYPWVLMTAASGSPSVVTTDLAGLRAAFPSQEPHATYSNGASILDADGKILTASRAAADAVAQPLSAAVAALIGQPTGAVHAGAWR